jgi:hypothetical protein
VPSSLLALLDDITLILDDVSVAAKRTAGVLGDDLALNAQQVTGVRPERELPVVWAVAKGSAVNKAILVPAALAISALLPVAIVPLLMFGGAFLCFEGVEKLVHKLFPHPEDKAHDEALHRAAADPAVDLVAMEKDKIKGAVRTDFILSAEIIAITLGVVASRPLGTQLGVLVGISLLMTVGVYGLVAGIVKLDDAGLRLSKGSGGSRAVGRAILAMSPWLMRLLSIAGTAAMFLVGGGILVHGWGWLNDLNQRLWSGTGAVLEAIGPTLGEGLAGVIAGILSLLLVKLVGGAYRAVRRAPAA